jgi:hypothetical protein
VAAGLNGVAQTTNKIAETHWQPTRAAVRVEDYAGSSACAACHGKESEKQMLSEMGRSVARPGEAPLLREHAEMSFKRSPYTYVLRTEGGWTSFTASDGKNKITEPVYLVVGSGTVFQAYLIQHGGAYYRVPADYFAAQGKLGPDPEASAELPATLPQPGERGWRPCRDGQDDSRHRLRSLPRTGRKTCCRDADRQAAGSRNL